MAEIIPRWEWRHFADSIKLAINLNDYEKTRHVESSEFYVLSKVCDENPKVRANKMDIKSLQQVNEDWLEQWKPIKKVDFPLPKDEMIELYRIFRLTPPELKDKNYTIDEFLDMARNDNRLMVFSVEKVRDLYDVNGCIVEYATVKVNGKKVKTAAAELEDPKKVKETVKKMGLWGKENINYVKALKRIAKGML